MTTWKYCANGEEGIEFVADTEKECQEWIDREIAGDGIGSYPVDEDYYHIVKLSQVQVDAMTDA